MTTDNRPTPLDPTASPEHALPGALGVPKPRASDPSVAVETSEIGVVDEPLDEGAIPASATDDTGPGAGTGTGTSAGRPAGGVRRMLVRLHFYAGVLIAPFLVVAALTGLAYTLTPQLDRIVYGDKLFVDVPPPGTKPRPLSEQVAAARTSHPEGTLSTVLTPPAPDRATEVVLDVEGLGPQRQRTVYVDPYTAQVNGELTTWWGSTPLTTWLDDLHRNLRLGTVGRYYSEVAASWLWVVALGGLWLWVARRRRTRKVRRVLAPDLAARGRRRTMSWHGSVGAWLVVGLLFLSATGLTWSRHAGANFTTMLDQLDARAPELDTALPRVTADTAATAAAATDTAPQDGHGEHDVTGSDEEQPRGEDRLISGIDGVLAGARTAGLDGPVELGLPADANSAWTVAQTDRVWPVRQSKAAIDPADGSVVSFAGWSQFPLPAKLSRLGVAGHMGELFGLVNQVLLAALAVGLLCVVVWGYRMWWQRRPVHMMCPDRSAPLGPPPARGAWRGVRRPAVVVCLLVAVGVGWALPVLGVTLAGFLLLDAALGTVARQRSRHRPPQ